MSAEFPQQGGKAGRNPRSMGVLSKGDDGMGGRDERMERRGDDEGDEEAIGMYSKDSGFADCVSNVHISEMTSSSSKESAAPTLLHSLMKNLRKYYTQILWTFPTNPCAFADLCCPKAALQKVTVPAHCRCQRRFAESTDVELIS